MQSHNLCFNRILNSPKQTPLFILEYTFKYLRMCDSLQESWYSYNIIKR